MHMQALIVALLVALCSCYAVWIVLPGSARRALAGLMLKLPLPAPLARPLAKTMHSAGGCGCDGCDAGAAPPKRAVVTVHRRR